MTWFIAACVACGRLLYTLTTEIVIGEPDEGIGLLCRPAFLGELRSVHFTRVSRLIQGLVDQFTLLERDFQRKCHRAFVRVAVHRQRASGVSLLGFLQRRIRAASQFPASLLHL